MLVNLRGPKVKFHIILQTQIYARGNKLALNIKPSQRNILSSIHNFSLLSFQFSCPSFGAF